MKTQTTQLLEKQVSEIVSRVLEHLRHFYTLSRECAAEITEASPVAPRGGPDGAILEGLRQWRKVTASREGVAPFMVFSNRTLNDLAQKAPKTHEELTLIHGFGPRKLERYGDAVLSTIEGLRVGCG